MNTVGLDLCFMVSFNVILKVKLLKFIYCTFNYFHSTWGHWSLWSVSPFLIFHWQVRFCHSCVLSQLLRRPQTHHQHTHNLTLLVLSSRTAATVSGHSSSQFQTAMAAEKIEQWTGRDPLAELDPAVKDIIGREKNRQVMGLELIASEVRFILYKCTIQT